jgi:predicted nuclease of restriction endonuclease-like (RecB) superfamily
MAGVEKNYYSILDSLKEKIRLARQKATIAVNSQLLSIYWEIGNTITQHQKLEGWGAKVIDRLAADLKTEFPDFKGLSPRNLRYMKSFAEAWPGFSILQPPVAKLQGTEKHTDTIVQPLVAQIPWAHHIVILNKIKLQKDRLFYIEKTLENGWSKSVLALQIESQLHLRQGKAITNFETTLPKAQSDLARETLKNPYLFDFLGLTDEIQERELEKALIQHIKKFMLELGRGFAYVGNQYNLNVEGDDFFLDLLFYNYHLHCFVVFELKVGDFKPEFTGKLNFYINTINEQIKGKGDAPTIGVLLCKTPNDTVVKFSLQGIETPMGVAEYEFTNALPKQLKGEMPTIEELEKEIEKEAIEFKEHLNPVDARLQAIKERLKGIKTEEIQTPASFEILQKLFTDGLLPLYRKIIGKLSTEFNEEFVSQSVSWTLDRQVVHSIDEVISFWKKEDNLRRNRELEFTYQLHGFRKGGAADFGEQQILRFEWREYWWGFTLLNHNNHEPFIKKLYHQPMTNEDQQQVIDLLITKVLDRIEWILEFMKTKMTNSN